MRRTRFFWLISLLASSRIWASEASLARTRLHLAASPLARAFLLDSFHSAKQTGELARGLLVDIFSREKECAAALGGTVIAFCFGGKQPSPAVRQNKI